MYLRVLYDCKNRRRYLPYTALNDRRVQSRCTEFTARYELIIYRVIHKSLRDFWPLQYSSRDGHAEGDHVNRGRDTPSFCPTLQVLDMSDLGDAADVNPANSKTQKAFLFPAHTTFRHDCPLAAKPASTPWRLLHKKNFERFSTYW